MDETLRLALLFLPRFISPAPPRFQIPVSRARSKARR